MQFSKIGEMQAIIGQTKIFSPDFCRTIRANKVTFRPICERIKRFFPTAKNQTHPKPCRIIILIVQIKCPVKLYPQLVD